MRGVPFAIAIVAIVPCIDVGARVAHAFVPPPYGAVNEPAIEGTYTFEGVEPGGVVEPSGVATIVHLGGHHYEMMEVVGQSTLYATCLRRGSIFACGWGRLGLPLGVALYNGGANGGAKGSALLDGEWTELGAVGIGRERLAGGDVQSGGTWSVVDGRNVVDKPYAGHVDVTVGGLVQEWIWSIDGAGARLGVGVRFGGMIAVGFNAYRSCGVVVYEIHAAGSRLDGVWVDPGRPGALGTETLYR